MRKFLTSIAAFAIILMQIQGVFGLTSLNTVTAREEQVILDNDAARVSVSAEVVEETIEWTLQYTKRAPDDVTMRSIRVKLAQAEDGTGTVVRKEGDLTKKDGDDWYREAEFTNTSEGKLVVTTPLDAKQLVAWLQIDSQTMGKTTTDVLTGADAEAKVVAAPEIPVTEEETKPEEEVVVDQTPVDVGKPELQEETATSTKEPVKQNDESKTEVADSDKPSEKADEIKVTDRLARFLAPQAHQRVGSTNASDPFGYTTHETNSQGIMPVNNEATQLNGTTNSDVRNYKYSDSSLSEGTSSVDSLLRDTSSFDAGYHNYTGGSGVTQYNVNTKKTVQALGNNQFKVQLDMIGDAIKPRPKADIVLVIDKSSSMTNKDGTSNTRWQKLVSAVKSFSEAVLTEENDFQIGLAAFGSIGNDEPYGEIASFTGMESVTSKISGFTSSAKVLQDHKLFDDAPTPETSGTPTFLGVDAGLRLLSNQDYGARDNTQKVLITITDGLPTFGPTENYYKRGDTIRPVAESLNQATPSLTNDGTTLRFGFDKNHREPNRPSEEEKAKAFYAGNGSNNTGADSVKRTTPMVDTRYKMSAHTGLAAFSIGLYTGSDAQTTLGDLGKNGVYYSNSLDSLTNSLMDILEMFTGQIVNAEFVDPMSKYVTKTSDKAVVSALTLENQKLSVSASGQPGYPSYADAVTVDETPNQVKITNVNLGGSATKRYGLRVSYTVELKEEYRDGTFYPTNGTTYLKNGASTANEYMHFAVPSVRTAGKTFDIEVIKNWNDLNNVHNTRRNIQIQLQTRINNDEWVNDGSTVTLSPANNYRWKFTGKSAYRQGAVAQYRAVEVGRVPGYNNPTYSPANGVSYRNATNGPATITVTNKLKLANFEFTKKFGDGQVRQGINFKIEGTNFTATTNTNGVARFTGLPIGEYIVKEVNPPAEFAGKEFTISVRDNNQDDKLDVTSSLGSGRELLNELKPIDLQLTKIDSVTQTELPNAKFALYDADSDELIFEEVTDKNGLLTIEGKLKAGNYRLRETEAPDGYDLMQGEFTFTITPSGKLTNFKYSGDDNDDVPAPELSFEENNEHGLLTITAKNQAKAPPALPMTGSTGVQIFVIIGLIVIGLAGMWKLNDWRKNRGGEGDA